MPCHMKLEPSMVIYLEVVQACTVWKQEDERSILPAKISSHGKLNLILILQPRTILDPPENKTSLVFYKADQILDVGEQVEELALSTYSG